MIVTEPLARLLVLHPGDVAVQEVALVDVQESTEEEPLITEVGFAVRETVGGRLNVAVTDEFENIVKVQVVDALTHEPENPPKVELPEGVAVSVIRVPLV